MTNSIAEYLNQATFYSNTTTKTTAAPLDFDSAILGLVAQCYTTNRYIHCSCAKQSFVSGLPAEHEAHGCCGGMDEYWKWRQEQSDEQQ